MCKITCHYGFEEDNQNDEGLRNNKVHRADTRQENPTGKLNTGVKLWPSITSFILANVVQETYQKCFSRFLNTIVLDSITVTVYYHWL